MELLGSFLSEFSEDQSERFDSPRAQIEKKNNPNWKKKKKKS